jgi:hypothetical protein
MLTLTQKKEKIFYFLRDIYDKCEGNEPFSLKKKRQEHSLDVPNFRHALDKAGLIETTGKKNGEHGSYYYKWMASVQPNLKTAEKLFEEMNKKTENKTPDKKTCITCGEDKKASEFYKHNSNKDRLTSSCKECMKAKQRKTVNETKKCSKCKQEKALSEYYKNAYNKDGLTSECKSCIKEREKEKRQRRQISQQSAESNKKEVIKRTGLETVTLKQCMDNNEPVESEKNSYTFTIHIPEGYILGVYSLGKYLLAAGVGYVIRLIIEKL